MRDSYLRTFGSRWFTLQTPLELFWGPKCTQSKRSQFGSGPLCSRGCELSHATRKKTLPSGWSEDAMGLGMANFGVPHLRTSPRAIPNFPNSTEASLAWRGTPPRTTSGASCGQSCPGAQSFRVSDVLPTYPKNTYPVMNLRCNTDSDKPGLLRLHHMTQDERIWKQGLGALICEINF